MPPAMVSSVDSISQKEKVVFIYKCLYGPPIKKKWLYSFKVYNRRFVGRYGICM